MCLLYLCLDLDRFLCECDWERDLDLLECLDLLDACFLSSTTPKSKITFQFTKTLFCITCLCLSMCLAKDRPGSIAAAMVDCASLTFFITSSSSLAAACGVSSGGFTMALLEWLILKMGTFCLSIIILINY